MELPKFEEIKKINKQAINVEESLNRILAQSSGCYHAVDILLNPDVKELALKNQRIFILVILAHVVKREIQEHETKVLFEGRSVDELIILYQKMILYLRRIEFGFPDEYLPEIAEYIISERISATAVFGIIDGSEIIIRKEKIRTEIIKIIGDYAL